jgi:PKD repeat protein
MSSYFGLQRKMSKRWFTRSIIILALLVPTSLLVGQIPLAYAPTNSSRNPHVSCQAVVTTVHDVIGNHFNATTEGALESGGPYGVLDTPVALQGTTSDLQPSLSPPCTFPNVNGTMAPTFVEIHGISLTTGSIVSDSSQGGKCGTKYQPVNGNGNYPGSGVYCTAYGVFQDTSAYTGNCEDLSNPNPKICIRLEIDRDWVAAGFCGTGTVCDNSTFDRLTPSQKIDVQGFVAWHPPANSGHGFSGWELHPLTAWRLTPSSPVVPAFSFTPTKPVQGQTVTFSGSATGGTAPYTFTWNFGDGTSATGSSAGHAYAAQGSYIVTLSVTDANGQSALVSKTIAIAPVFATSFTFSPSSPAPGTSVSFTATATGGISPYSFSWSFGDGGSATGNPTSHIFSASGSYTVTLTTSDSAGHTAVFSNNVIVPGNSFNLASNPSLLTVRLGRSSQSTIAVTSLAGFEGTVTLTLSVSSPGLTVSLEDSSVTLSAGDSVTDDLSVSTTSTSPTGLYVVTVKGTSGLQVHSANVTVRVPDFNMTANPATLVIPAGSSGSSQILFKSLDGFHGSVSTQVTVNPAGPILALNPTSPTLVANGTAIAVLSIQVPSNLPPGIYNVTITAASGLLHHLLVVKALLAQHPSATIVSCSLLTVIVNQAFTCTATVNDTSTRPIIAPTGIVTFTETGPTGSFTPTTCALSVGRCSVTFTPSTTGSALVTAAYAGDSTHKSSTSAPVSITANPRTTSTSVVCSSPVVVNQATNCTATVADSSGSGGITPTGNVLFTPGGSCTLVSGSCPISTTPSTVGSFSVSASYSGDSSHSTSSGIATVTVGNRATSTSLSCLPSPVASINVTGCVATVTDTDVGGKITPSGSVSFSSNSTGVFAQPSCTLASTGIVGVASCLVNYAPGVIGFHRITVSYAGDSSHLSSSSGSATVKVIAPPKPAYALVVSTDGKVFRLYQNGTLILVGQPVTTPLRTIAWKPDGSYALISGDDGVLLKYDGTTLTTIATGMSTGLNLWTVSWKPDGSYALIGGSVGTLFKYDGVTVTTITNPFSTTILSISWHPSGSYALLVGRNGLALTYDGTTIRSISTGTTSDLLTAAWNPNGAYALVGGVNGILLRFNGTGVAALNTSIIPAGNAIHSISFNRSGSLAILAGDNGMVLSYNGSTLTMLSMVTFSWLYYVSWSPSGTAYIVGGSGNVLTYANGALTSLLSGTTFQFRGIAWKPQ